MGIGYRASRVTVKNSRAPAGAEPPRGRSGTPSWQQLTVQALPSGRADRSGGRGGIRMGNLRRRQEVREDSPYTRCRVINFAGPV